MGPICKHRTHCPEHHLPPFINCSPTALFHGRTTHSALDLKFRNPTHLTNQPTDISMMIDEVNQKCKQNLHKIVRACDKYKTSYDRNTSSQLLKVNDFVFLLNSKYDDQNSEQHFKSLHWQGPCKVMKVLSKSNYIFRQIENRRTQRVHRMRPRLFVPQHEIDESQVNQRDLYPDANVVRCK